MSVKDQETSKEVEVEEKKSLSPYFEEFMNSFSGAANVEEKLKLAVGFMEASLSRPEGPRFGDFWEARKLCLPLFREGIEGELRGELWTSYTYLTGEAKSLREKVDQEGQFAIEQIELALEAIEKDIAAREEAKAGLSDLELPEFMNRNTEELQEQFRELVILDALASRLTALRKELVDTQIRMRHKNALFQRLSKVGDEIFPPRKELLRGVTDSFIDTVETFARVKFPNNEPRGPLHVLRDEIKRFQSLAKTLRLTPKGFNKSRQILSRCWDAVREQSEERRKAWAEKKEVFEANKAGVTEKIEAFGKRYIEEELSIEEGQKEVQALEKEIRETELGHDEVKALKAELTEACKPLQEKLDEIEKQRRAEEEARIKEREEAKAALQTEVEQLLAKADSLSIDEITAEREALVAKVKEAPLPKFEKGALEKSLRPLCEVLRRKKEEALLSLSDDDKEALSGLQEVLAQRQERCGEIKKHLEEIRKLKGSSNLDFEKGMELVEEEGRRKEELDEAESGVREIEERIAKIKG